MSGPQTEAGRALMEAFTTKPGSPDFAIRISQESVIRHAVPAIEREAVRAYKAELAVRLPRALHDAMCTVSHHDRYPATPPPCLRKYELIVESRAVLALLDEPVP